MALFNTFQGNLEAFSFAVVFDSEGRPVPISRFWKQNTAILVFLRHFGCIACRAHAQEIWQKREELQKGQGRVIFIGNGDPVYIEGFRQDFGLDAAPIFTDPTLKTFTAAGFHRGVKHLVNGKSLANAVALSRRGYKNSNPLNTDLLSHLQLGGVIVAQPGPKVNYHYISEALGDTPQAEEIVVSTTKSSDAE